MGSQGSSRSRSGSSPLARGTQVQKFRERWLRRLIPARAGNTRAVAPGRAPGTAHPRSRGEHSELLWLLGQDCGSSPLARGTQSERGVGLIGWRLIPARAGNTRFSGLRDPARAAHPRSRGEHTLLILPKHGLPGSSPLARGTRSVLIWPMSWGRLIPARAGNTFPLHRNRLLTAAHPRSRGEHPSGSATYQICHGSSPLARGTPTGGGGNTPRPRRIPARAGNTVASVVCKSPWTAHPRSRGEHPLRNVTSTPGCGSSPLARGTPHQQ